MTLAEYLKTRDETPAILAEAMGINPVTVYRWLKGETRPNKTQMASLIKLTEGKVTPNDFYGSAAAE